MGNRQSSRLSSVDGNGNRRPLPERNRYGVCIIKIASNTPPPPVPNNNRRNQDRQNTHVLTPRGGILFGSQCNPQLIQRALIASGFPFHPPTEVPLNDSRAHKLLVIYSNGWHAIPSPEVFSRHSGTCIILGDRNNTSAPYQVKLGDCFRLGSVGLVVSEMKTLNGDEQRLDSKMLQYLKDEALALDSVDDVAALAAEENDMQNCDRHSEKGSMINGKEDYGGVGNGERFICYMCYETHDTPEDPLVAPCDCKGDTRYLHVHCLQKWYHSSVCGPQAQVIRTTGNGAPACKICGAAYKTAFRRADGRKANLLEMDGSGPYISLVVVTRHDTNPGLFNTKFRLNFGRLHIPGAEPGQDMMEGSNELIIGRSSSCNMILDYRTVSTVHAKISYERDNFYMVDRRSSNGTMVYLQEPLPLQFSTPVRMRMGRTTLTLQAKRSFSASIRGFFSTRGGRSTQNDGYLTPAELQALMAPVGMGIMTPPPQLNTTMFPPQQLLGPSNAHMTMYPAPTRPVFTVPAAAVSAGAIGAVGTISPASPSVPILSTAAMGTPASVVASPPPAARTIAISIQHGNTTTVSTVARNSAYGSAVREVESGLGPDGDGVDAELAGLSRAGTAAGTGAGVAGLTMGGGLSLVVGGAGTGAVSGDRLSPGSRGAGAFSRSIVMPGEAGGSAMPMMSMGMGDSVSAAEAVGSAQGSSVGYRKIQLSSDPDADLMADDDKVNAIFSPSSQFARPRTSEKQSSGGGCSSSGGSNGGAGIGFRDSLDDEPLSPNERRPASTPSPIGPADGRKLSGKAAAKSSGINHDEDDDGSGADEIRSGRLANDGQIERKNSTSRPSSSQLGAGSKASIVIGTGSRDDDPAGDAVRSRPGSSGSSGTALDKASTRAGLSRNSSAEVDLLAAPPAAGVFGSPTPGGSSNTGTRRASAKSTDNVVPSIELKKTKGATKGAFAADKDDGATVNIKSGPGDDDGKSLSADSSTGALIPMDGAGSRPVTAAAAGLGSALPLEGIAVSTATAAAMASSVGTITAQPSFQETPQGTPQISPRTRPNTGDAEQNRLLKASSISSASSSTNRRGSKESNLVSGRSTDTDGVETIWRNCDGADDGVSDAAESAPFIAESTAQQTAVPSRPTSAAAPVATTSLSRSGSRQAINRAEVGVAADDNVRDFTVSSESAAAETSSSSRASVSSENAASHTMSTAEDSDAVPAPVKAAGSAAASATGATGAGVEVEVGAATGTTAVASKSTATAAASAAAASLVSSSLAASLLSVSSVGPAAATAARDSNGAKQTASL